MNVQMKDITVTARDGRVSHLDQIYIRGSHVRFFIVPDMLRYVPFTPFPLFSFLFAFAWFVFKVPEANSVETLPCSAPEASAVEVLGWRVVRPRCRGLGASGGVDPLLLLWSLFSCFVLFFIKDGRRFYFLVITTNLPTKIRLHGIIAIHFLSPLTLSSLVSVFG